MMTFAHQLAHQSFKKGGAKNRITNNFLKLSLFHFSKSVSSESFLRKGLFHLFIQQILIECLYAVRLCAENWRDKERQGYRSNMMSWVLWRYLQGFSTQADPKYLFALLLPLSMNILQSSALLRHYGIYWQRDGAEQGWPWPVHWIDWGKEGGPGRKNLRVGGKKFRLEGNQHPDTPKSLKQMDYPDMQIKTREVGMYSMNPVVVMWIVSGS